MRGGRAEPSGLHMAGLLRVLPELADLLDVLDTQGTRPTCSQPAGTRAS
jgi:hypothetical protein